MFKIKLFIASLLFVVCFGLTPQYTFYKGYDCTGELVTIQSKYPDLTSVSPDIIRNHKSNACVGTWGLSQSLNYTGVRTFRWASGCWNVSYPYYGSARYLGAPDTETQAISFYSATKYGDTELVITEPAFADIPFPPLAIFSQGWSNWTFYSGGNFNGTALCYRSTAEIHRIESLNTTFAGQIKSILRGCNGRIDTVLFAESMETENLATV